MFLKENRQQTVPEKIRACNEIIFLEVRLRDFAEKNYHSDATLQLMRHYFTILFFWGVSSFESHMCKTSEKITKDRFFFMDLNVSTDESQKPQFKYT